MIVVLLVGAAVWGLSVVQAPWNRAAALSRDLVASATAQLDGHEVLWVLGLPGTYQGRYVLQNGLAASIDVFGRGEGPQAVSPLTMVDLTAAEARSSAHVEHLEGRRVRITQELEGGILASIRLPERWHSEGSSPGEVSPTVVLEGPLPPRVTLVAVEGRSFRILVPAGGKDRSARP